MVTMSTPPTKREITAVIPSLIPHSPHPKQLAFLCLTKWLESLYGGSAGGGKSDALMMAAAQYFDVPGYAALILRRTYRDLSLPGALMDRAHKWFEGKATWKDIEKTWHFPAGSTLTFGYLDSENDKYRYQSSEFQYIAFDELTQFTETQYLYLFSRLRSTIGLNVPLRMRAASNPGGIGHDWVKLRFIDKGKKEGRIFLRATIRDNPSLDEAEYLKSLSHLDPITRRQLMDGDWTARQAGGMFRREWFGVPVVNFPLTAIIFCRFWDMASTKEKPGRLDPDYTVGTLMGRTIKGMTYIVDVVRVRETPGTVEDLIKQTSALDKARLNQDYYIRMEQEPGASGVAVIDHYRRLVLPGYDFNGVRPSGKKHVRARPYSSQTEAGNVILVEGPWNLAFIDEHEGFGQIEHDDQVDASSGAYNELVEIMESGGPSEIVQTVGGARLSKAENPLGLDEDEERYWDTDRMEE